MVWLEMSVRGTSEGDDPRYVATRIELDRPIREVTLPLLREYSAGLTVRLYELIGSRGLKA